MKMPEESIRPDMFAPCGMNCMVCYRHWLSQETVRRLPGRGQGKTGTLQGL